MRIGFVIYGSLETLTGGYLYDAFIVKSLRERGHDVEVIGLPSGSYLKKILQGVSPKLSRKLLRGKFDVIIQDELCHPTFFRLNSILCRQDGPHLVALVHHVFSQEQRNPWLNKAFSIIEHRYLNSVDGFIHNSATTRGVVTSIISQAKPEVIAYPAGNRFACNLTRDEVSQRANTPGPLELLFLGNITPRKGLVPLLQTLSGLDNQFWRLTIVGGTDFDPKHSNNIKTLIKQLGIDESVNFLGALKDDKLVEIFRTRHIFCMPYAYEGFGIAMLEAMSFGQPAIASTMGAAGETVRHGENGFIIAPEQRKPVQEILADLYHNRAKLMQISICARATYENSPGWQEATEKIEHFLKNLLVGAASSLEGNPQISGG